MARIFRADRSTSVRSRWGRRALSGCLIVVAAVMLGLAPPAHGAGSFEVTLSSTGDGWVAHGSGGKFSTSHNRVFARAGKSAAGSWREWRRSLPSRHLRILGGSIRIGWSLPRPGFKARIRVGSGGGATRTLLSSRSGSSATVSLPADLTWIGLGLHAESDASPGTTNANAVTFQRAHLRLTDIAGPTLTMSGAPGPGTWIGPDCRTVRLVARDSGSGVRTTRLVDASADRALASGTHSSTRQLQPGAGTATRETCLNSARLAHGTREVLAEATDVSGRTTRVRARVLVDGHPPKVQGLPADGTAFRTSRPRLGVRLSDEGSGVESVSARIDGEEATVVRDGTAAEIEPAGALTLGQHEVTVVVRDRAGHEIQARRRFDVGDLDAPALQIVRPHDIGGVEPVVEATATDGVSGVDPDSWTVSVNGSRIDATGTSGRLLAELGRLVGGRHTLVVSVADRAGNRRTRRWIYTARVPGDGVAASAGAVGSATGVLVRRTPKAPVRHGARGRYLVVATRAGRPLALRTVEARLGGRVVGRATTDRNGIVSIAVRAVRPGKIRFSVRGAGLRSKAVRMRVAPRIRRIGGASRATTGRSVQLRARIGPRGAARRAVLQARAGNTWYTVREGIRVSRSGIVTTRVTSSVTGRVRVRVLVPAQRGWATAWSPAKVIHFRR